MALSCFITPSFLITSGYLVTALEKFGIASLEAALEMARAAAELFHTDLGLAITGLSPVVLNTAALASDTRPGAARPRNNRATVHLAVPGPPQLSAARQQHRSLTLPWPRTNWFRVRAGYGALALLWTSLRRDELLFNTV